MTKAYLMGATRRDGDVYNGNTGGVALAVVLAVLRQERAAEVGEKYLHVTHWPRTCLAWFVAQPAALAG